MGQNPNLLSASSTPVSKRTIQKVTASPQPKPFDFGFVNTDRQVREILTTLTQEDPEQDVIVVSHPDNLAQDNLAHRLMMSEDGRHSLTSGKLFDNDKENGEQEKPLTLVLDIRNLTSEELPQFNDLLDPDSPCLYDPSRKQKRPLGKHVKLRVLANPQQLTSVGRDKTAPGADFWRRINRPDNTWQLDQQNNSQASMDVDTASLLQECPSATDTMDHSDIITIDCHLSHGWRQLLFGGPGVDNEGRIKHIPGKLEQLQPGQQVILKGANWNDLAFEQAIRLLIARQRYDSNGQSRSLPKGISFYRSEVDSEELGQLLRNTQSVKKDRPHKLVIINNTNLAGWLDPIGIDQQGCVTANTSLSKQVESGSTVTVTSPLSEPMWFALLGTLQTINQQTDRPPELFVAHPKDQPESLNLKAASLLQKQEQAIGKLPKNPQLQAITYSHQQQVHQWLESQKPKPLVIQVNEQTSLAQLFDNIHIISEKEARFGRLQTGLQKALNEVRSVVISGLETNPSLQQALEPLCCGQPLLIHGSPHFLPNSKITLLWPQSIKSPSPLWSNALSAASQCPELNIWESAACRHDIQCDEIPGHAINGMYKAFDTIPKGLSPSLGQLPPLTTGLLDNLIRAARQAQQRDSYNTLEPQHWRKAINSVLTHGTRQNPEARGFMKVACEQLLPDKNPEAWADPDRLNHILNDCNNKLDRDFVKKHFWQLARAFHPKVFESTETEQLGLHYLCPGALDSMCALIAAHTPESLRSSVAFQLQANPERMTRYKNLPVRPSVQIRRLEDALSSGWHIKTWKDQSRSDLIRNLANQCYNIARNDTLEEPQQKAQITQQLQSALQWKGKTNKPIEALAEDLLKGNISQEDREQRRLTRLKDRLRESPVTFLQGETGTGKSYFAASMANKAGPAFIASIGPSASEQTLMRRWVWKEREDDDRAMEQQDQILLEWAKTKVPPDGSFVTLVLDEANLAKQGLLASLKGLWQNPPCIYVNGHPQPVSDRHRVILTGNPDHYAGRQLDPALQAAVQRVHYPPLNQAFLQDRVIEPALRQQLRHHMNEDQAESLAKQATKSILALWQHYPELLPDRDFTPRDLTDICSRLGWYLHQAQASQEQKAITPEKINALVLQGFRDTLNSEIPYEKQDALTALESWFEARYPVDRQLLNQTNGNTLKLISNYFRFETGINKPQFDTSATAVSELVQQLGQDLSRCQQAYQRGERHGGRQATIIEGPAGRGKDATLQLLINSFKAQVEHNGERMPEVHSLNACDCSWEPLRNAIQQAKVNGGILVISEMNLIDSQHLEGELNDILAGDAHPGFHLFATTNPPEYSGRKPLSPALKNRFRHIPIREYNYNELVTIAQKALPDNQKGEVTAKRLTEWHCRLRRHLQQKNLPMQPTSLDLQKLARETARQQVCNDDDALQALFNRHYRLYLMAAQCSLDTLPEVNMSLTADSHCHKGLCHWFNQTAAPEHPWLIRRGESNRMDSNRSITVKAQHDELTEKKEIIKMVAQEQWRHSGLPLAPPSKEDSLTQALFRYWQHCWFDRHFACTGIKAREAFPISEAQARTLGMEANQPYLAEANRLINEQPDFAAIHLRTACWEQLRQILKKPVGYYQQKKASEPESTLPFTDQRPPPSMTDQPPEKKELLAQPDSGPSLAQDTPEQLPDAPDSPKQPIAAFSAPAIKTLDRKTDFAKEEELPQIQEIVVFDSIHHPAMYRLRVADIKVTPNDDMVTIESKSGAYGLESVIPGKLPEQSAIPLAPEQTMGVHSVTPVKTREGIDQWIPLPGLTAHETITGMRTEPDTKYNVIKDRYTGLHKVHFPEAIPGQRITVYYVVTAEKQDEHKGKNQQAWEYRHYSGVNLPERSDATASEAMEKEINRLFKPDNMRHLSQSQQDELNKIKQAKAEGNQQALICAITTYCKKFDGQSHPESGDNLLFFLLNKRQGSCRHRAPVFVAFCHYFGIPSRCVYGDHHLFAEYSLDNGQTWQNQDLGGAPVNTVSRQIPDFQKTQPGMKSTTSTQQMAEQLKNTPPEQLEALAKALNVTMEELNRSIESGCTLPIGKTSQNKGALDRSALIRNLWEQKDPSAFSIGTNLLINSEELSPGEEILVSPPIFSEVALLVEVLVELLSTDAASGEVIEQLEQLHTKHVAHESISRQSWNRSIVKILNRDKLQQSSPQIISFAKYALESGWLNPEDTHKSDSRIHHQVLMRLQAIDETKVLATASLKKWYRYWFSGKNLTGEEFIDSFRNKSDQATSSTVSHDHGGKSPYLESVIATRSWQPSWTDQPEGVPNIERMLTHNPAFPQTNSGKIAPRPVIVMGHPYWDKSTLSRPKKSLCRRYLKDYLDDIDLDKKYTTSDNLMKYHRIKKLKAIFVRGGYRRINELFGKTIKLAFGHYLFDTVHSKGGRLIGCWTHEFAGNGSCSPLSPQELIKIMETTSSKLKRTINDQYLLQANNASNGVVLKDDQLTTIAEEFMDSVNLETLYQEASQYCEKLED